MTNQERLLAAIDAAPSAKLGFIKPNGKVVFTCSNPVDLAVIAREMQLAYQIGTKGIFKGTPSWVARPSTYELLMRGDLVVTADNFKKKGALL